MQRTNQKEFRIEKVIKKIGWVSNGKAVIIISIVRLRKKTLSRMSQYFPIIDLVEMEIWIRFV